MGTDKHGFNQASDGTKNHRFSFFPSAGCGGQAGLDPDLKPQMNARWTQIPQNGRGFEHQGNRDNQEFPFSSLSSVINPPFKGLTERQGKDE